MHSFVLEGFGTYRGGTTVTTITQSEHGWLDLSGYQDVTAWIDVREVTLGGATSLQWNIQTAPIRDEYLFVTMESSPLTATAALTAPSVRKIILAQCANGATAPFPLGRFLRWQLVVNGTPTASWDATFRIVVCANPLGMVPTGASGPARTR
jgi:hypothetical protein